MFNNKEILETEKRSDTAEVTLRPTRHKKSSNKSGRNITTQATTP